MANLRNSRDKKEHFTIIDNIMDNPVMLAIAIGVILLIIIAIFLIMNHSKAQGGAGMMEYMSDISPMAPLTNTPSM